jgi:release factor glutamine methyltransferase
MRIDNWLQRSAKLLTGVEIDSARLDAELILAHALNQSREWITSHPDTLLQGTTLQKLDELHTRRLNREPIAYILGKKEFYGREFIVTPDVLVPRPETETIVEVLKKLFDEDFPPSHSKTYIPDDADRFAASGGSAGRPAYDVFEGDGSEEKTVSAKPVILDVGTGSGVIAITLALELPNSEIIASDISEKALEVARRNAEQLGATVKFVKSDLLQNICDNEFDIIIANLPYGDKNWGWIDAKSLSWEPSLAIFADDHGLELIKKLIVEAPRYLTANGQLILELDPCQTKAVKQFANQHDFSIIDEKPYVLVLQHRRVPETAEHE